MFFIRIKYSVCGKQEKDVIQEDGYNDHINFLPVFVTFSCYL